MMSTTTMQVGKLLTIFGGYKHFNYIYNMEDENYKNLSQFQINLLYKLNVWWTDVRDYLESNQIKTIYGSNKEDDGRQP